MKMSEINIRDPYIMVQQDRYYMYGTRSETCWETADGFDCFVSENLEDWEGPFEIFRRPEGFFADRNYWAPECYCYKEAFYLVTTFGCESQKKGIYILKAKAPTGPFEICSGRLTPDDWSCIDGTLYFDNEIPYLVFSHSFEDHPDGDMCYIELSQDLKTSKSKPELMFSAAEADWARPVPFAEAEFGMKGDVYFTDGPCLMKMEDGRLYMTWSSWSNHGYAVGAALSASGTISGPWRQQKKAVYPENGGHGMLFRNRDGKLKFTLHFPNDKYQERPQFVDVKIEDGLFLLEEEKKKDGNEV